MFRLFLLSIIVFINILLPISDARSRGSYTSGIADLVRQVVKRGFNRFLNYQTSYDSDVFRYTLTTQFGRQGLYGGESCRLSPMICSYDEQCCSGRCLCRRWSIMGEERCIRKCS